MRRLSLLLPCVVGAALIACSSSGINPAARTDRSINLGGANGDSQLRYFDQASSRVDHLLAPPNAIWPKLVTVYSALSIPITSIDTIGHVLGAVRASVTGRIGKRQLSSIVECGQTAYGSPRANSYRISLTAVTELAPDKGGTKVSTVVTATAQEESVSSTPAQCSSTGALERDIATGVGVP